MSISKVLLRCTSRYEPLRQLGQSQLTRVYLAAERRTADVESPRLLALELLHKELAKDDDFRALFLDQAASTLQLQHPSVIQTYDVVTDAEASGLTQEFLQGKTLAQLSEQARWVRALPPTSPDEGGMIDPTGLCMQLHILCCLLEALHYIHHLPTHGSASALVHRDISPGSVFITYDGQVKLLGAGFAQARQLLERRLGRLTSDIGYAAPELLLGYSAGPSADLYSAGVMLWEAIAGQRRVFGDPRELTIRRRTSGEEPDLERVCVGAPPELVEICRRALRVSPRHRYATAMEFGNDLKAYLAGAERRGVAVGQASLMALMREAFAEDLAEMDLFIGSGLAAVEQSEPAVADVAVRAAQAARLEGGANEACSPEARSLGEISVAKLHADEDPDEPTVVAPAPAPELPRDSDTGGHRAFSSSLARTPIARSLVSHFAVPAAAMLLCIVAALSIARLTRERGQSSPAPLTRMALRDLSSEAGPKEANSEARSEGAGRRSGIESGAVTEPGDNSGAADGTLESPDAGAAVRAVPPSAFLDAPLGSVETRPLTRSAPGVSAWPAEGLLPSDLPVLDEDEDRLQQAILAAARVRQRAATAHSTRVRRGKLPARSNVLDNVSVAPRPIDETDPYATSPSAP
jgi:hypothetical protein